MGGRRLSSTIFVPRPTKEALVLGGPATFHVAHVHSPGIVGAPPTNASAFEADPHVTTPLDPPSKRHQPRHAPSE